MPDEKEQLAGQLETIATDFETNVTTRETVIARIRSVAKGLREGAVPRPADDPPPAGSGGPHN